MYLEITDQMNQIIRFGQPPKRIISLVPSQTELLHYLGLKDNVVGITKFCIHPDQWFRSKSRVGGTKSVDFAKIKALNPDFIIANKEENSKADIERLKIDYPVYTSDIVTLEDAFDMISGIGQVCGKAKKAEGLIEQIKGNFSELLQIKNKSALYFIWNAPYMTVGKGTFIDSMMTLCGIKNADYGENRYNEISVEAIREVNPDYIFLSSEPFPFNAKHVAEIGQISKAKIVLTDGEMFSWYGNRLLKFKDYWEKELYRELTNR